jgi:hypothetical protein
MMIILSTIEPELMTEKQRQEIESRLANYNIPLQIFQIVAERCECSVNYARNDLPRGTKIAALLAGLNNRSIVLLKQMFLDCEDSFSNFRFAVFLSSRFSPMSHKFVMDGEASGGRSKLNHTVDICIYTRQTEELVAVGMQNKDTDQPASTKSLQKFLSLVGDLRSANPALRGAYYASSYGYDVDWAKAGGKKKASGNPIEIKLFEYRDKIYFETKSASSLLK